MAKVALLIGVSEYEKELSPLPAAIKDVHAMQRVLQHPEMGDFASFDITLLKNPERQEMEEAIEKLPHPFLNQRLGKKFQHSPINLLHPMTLVLKKA